MIKTVQPVSYDPVNLNKKEIVFARVKQAIRNDDQESYTLIIEDWVEKTYTENVPVEGGQMEFQTFTDKIVVRTTQRAMTFDEADQLTAVLDGMFPITATGSRRRKQYTILGHLLINNSEGVRNVNWELV